MKVLHINKRDSGGGAFTACERLHRGLLDLDIDSWILCEVPSGKVPRSLGLRKGNKRGRLYERIRGRLRFEIRRLQKPPFFVEPNCHTTISLNFLSNNLVNRIHEIKPDIVHLHWVGAGMMRIEDLPEIMAKFPVVWTLHDLWPLMGGEHHAYSDERWKTGYTRENRCLSAKGPDLNRWVWNRKMRAWGGSTIHTIAVSQWVNDCISASRIFNEVKGKRRVIHNGLDESVFRLSQETKNNPRGSDSHANRPWRLLFGAVAQDNPIKGGDLLYPTLQVLKAGGRNVELVTFGRGVTKYIDEMPVLNHGKIHSQLELAQLYASADLMLVPSRLETFGQIASEALACGTPVVCFDTSGLRDVVLHKRNGYRAKCYDPFELAKGIEWCLGEPARLDKLKASSREHAVKYFSIAKIAKTTVDFYNEIFFY